MAGGYALELCENGFLVDVVMSPLEGHIGVVYSKKNLKFYGLHTPLSLRMYKKDQIPRRFPQNVPDGQKTGHFSIDEEPFMDKSVEASEVIHIIQRPMVIRRLLVWQEFLMNLICVKK